MAVPWASNSILDFEGSYVSTSSGYFDSTRVPYAIRVYRGQETFGPDWSPTVGDVTWLHCRMYAPNFTNSNGGDLINLYAEDGRQIFRIYGQNDYWNGHFMYLYDGATSKNVSISLGGAIQTLDIKITVTGSEVAGEIWTNGGILGQLSFGANAGSLGPPAKIRLGGGRSDSVGGNFSEIIISEEDTRGLRLNMLRPTGVGNYSNWSGTFADINDDDAATGLISSIANDLHSVALSTYAGGPIIHSVVMGISAKNSPIGSKDMNAFIRKGAVNYDGDSHRLSLAGISFFDPFAVDPSDSNPWTIADFTGLELGFKLIDNTAVSMDAASFSMTGNSIGVTLA